MSPRRGGVLPAPSRAGADPGAWRCKCLIKKWAAAAARGRAAGAGSSGASEFPDFAGARAHRRL